MKTKKLPKPTLEDLVSLAFYSGMEVRISLTPNVVKKAISPSKRKNKK